MSTRLLSEAMREVYELWHSGRAELDEAIILVSMSDSTGEFAKRLRNALEGRSSFSAAIYEQRTKEAKA